jgi:outer membrane protein OmpA-like peptidoglycan-associated protein
MVVMAGATPSVLFAQEQTQSGSSTYVAPQKLNPKAARITIYRPDQGETQGISRLTVNGRYHVSLQRGKYTEICLQPNEISLSAQIIQTADGVENQKYGLSFKTKAGESYFARVEENSQRIAVVSPVDTEQALVELKSIRRQATATSRVQDLVECVDPNTSTVSAAAPEFTLASAAAPEAAKTPPSGVSASSYQNIVLLTDALFGFGKSDMKGITGEGRESLDQLIQSLRQQHGNLEKTKLNIVGHSDLMGSPSANMHLSEARASAVREYLLKGGLGADKVSSQGRGDIEPVVASCAKSINLENIECNKPNRRVVVVVQALDR